VLRDASRGAESPLSDNEFQQDERLLALVAGRQAIVVWNKVDLATAGSLSSPGGLQSDVGSAVPRGVPESDANAVDHPVVAASALTGAGVEQLRSTIVQLVGGNGAQQERGFLTNVRQKQLVSDAIAALDKATAAVPQNIPHEMLLLDLYNALRPLDEITGATTADDILNLIFSSFCIGK
jgi:tRNA modification GTPase